MRASGLGLWLSLSCALACSACSSTPSPDASAAGTWAQTSAGTSAGVSAGSAGTAGMSGAAGSSPTGSLTGRGTPSKTPPPCDVAEILKLRCQSCHAATPLAGVPMSLVWWEDFAPPAVTRPDQTVAQRVAERVHDAENPMPPTGLLAADELAVLDAWIAGGAVAGQDSTCAPEQGGPDGGVVDGPPPDSTCYTLRAHGAPVAGDTSPWMVANQHYACFYFDMPWPEGAQGVYFAPDFDAHPELVHHWVMYLDQNGNKPDGHVEACSGLHPSGPTMVAGWAPGADNNGLPPDVGLDLSPKNKKLLVEFHFYHDGVSPPVPTTSGVKVCTSNKKLPNTATVSLLGTEAIVVAPASKGVASGTCTPQYDGEIHILRSWPHMHAIGAGMKTEVFFSDGKTQLLGPWKFDFNNQVSYATPLVVRPGDRLVTTCEYDNDTLNWVTTGTGSDQEMCFNFVTAYPAGALASKNAGGGSTSATANTTACLQ